MAGSARMHIAMAGVAEYQRLASACGHDVDLPGLRRLAWPLEVAQVADVVDFEVVVRAT